MDYLATITQPQASLVLATATVMAAVMGACVSYLAALHVARKVANTESKKIAHASELEIKKFVAAKVSQQLRDRDDAMTRIVQILSRYREGTPARPHEMDLELFEDCVSFIYLKGAPYQGPVKALDTLSGIVAPLRGCIEDSKSITKKQMQDFHLAILDFLHPVRHLLEAAARPVEHALRHGVASSAERAIVLDASNALFDLLMDGRAYAKNEGAEDCRNTIMKLSDAALKLKVNETPSNPRKGYDFAVAVTRYLREFFPKA